MLELAPQPQQPHNRHNLNATGIGARFEEVHRPRFQRVADKMQARFMNASCETDHDIVKRFCERMLPITFLDWMCKP